MFVGIGVVVLKLSLQRVAKAVAVYREPAVLALVFLGFSSGLPLALTASTLFVWLTEAGVDKAAIGLFAAIGTPYALKFMWAPLMDRVPVPLLARLVGHRRGWILLTQMGLVAAILTMGALKPGVDPWALGAMALVVAFLSASQDIVIDAFRIESLEERQQAGGAAALVFGYRVGMLVSGAGGLYLAHYSGWTTAYSVMAALVLVGGIAVLLRPEPDAGNGNEWNAEAQEARAEAVLAEAHVSSMLAHAAGWLYAAVIVPFAEFMSRPRWLVILLFVALYKFGDSLAGIMTNPFLIEIGFSKLDIANISKLYGFTATMIGLVVGGALMNGIGMVRSLWLCGILQLASNFMFAVQAMVGADIGLLAVTIGFENFAGGMGTAVFVAYLSSLCNVSYTATQYALLSSFMAVARTWLSSSSGYLAEWFGWVDFFILTAGAAVPGLVLLWWLTRNPSLRPKT
ncbi:MAG: AmpG family muropeptide MFS transporter [Rhodospirillales bacterium]|nr:AmpG family muropeptide MFS transporter [Rhodospirillales bacterium]